MDHSRAKLIRSREALVRVRELLRQPTSEAIDAATSILESVAVELHKVALGKGPGRWFDIEEFREQLAIVRELVKSGQRLADGRSQLFTVDGPEYGPDSVRSALICPQRVLGEA
jgi:hypothetical protein